MKAFDLKPTLDNLITTFKKDTIKRNADIFRFTEILDAIEDSCSIALDGNWGSGKTFFVKQVKMVMDAHNNHMIFEDEENRKEIIQICKRHYKIEKSLEPQVSVYYDAWMNDNDDDPILSLVYTILNDVNTDFSFRDTDSLKLGAAIIEFFSGKNWYNIIDTLRGSSPLDALSNQKEIEKTIGEFLDSLIVEKGKRLIIFIDELDRCKPNYAVHLLERIKHYFSHDMVTFVFSVNTNELQHTIKQYYGSGFDGSKYLNRFFDLKICIPPIDTQAYYRTLDFNDRYYTYDLVCGAVIKAFRFELRDIAKYLRMTKIAAYKQTHSTASLAFSDGGALGFCLFSIIPVMIGLMLHDMRRYTDFITGKDYTPLIEVNEYLNNRVFFDLLDPSETFDPKEKDKAVVTVENKIKAVYEAIFITEYSGNMYQTTIGGLVFYANLKNDLLRITGLLSDFSNYD